MSIIEKNSRCEYYTNNYAGISGIAAEMEIEEEGKTCFLYCDWTSAVEDALDYMVTRKSIFDILTEKEEPEDDVESIFITKEYNVTYAGQFAKLEQMLHIKAAEEGIDYGYFASDEIKHAQVKEMEKAAAMCRYAIFWESEVHGVHDQPCISLESALECAQAIYEQESEFGKVTQCQVCEVEIGYSEIIGFVYGNKKVIKDFILKA